MRNKLFLFAYLFCAAALCAVSGRCGAQDRRAAPAESLPPVAAATPSNVLVSAEEDYRLGASDVIEIRIEKAPELSRMFRVGTDGSILMPYLNRVKVEGLTTVEVERALADGLRGRYLRNPQVQVAVRQYNSRAIFIQGAVRSPGVYQMEGKPSLLMLITMAGGLIETHGSSAFIIRRRKHAADAAQKPETAPGQPADAPGAASGADQDAGAYELVKANVTGLLSGNFSQNVTVEPGDIVNIPPKDVFFVAGEVKGPGSFPLKDGTTLRQAISLAQGTTVRAALDRAIIFREDPATGQRKEIRVHVGAVMDGKQEDVVLAANDVVIVPNSRAKTVGSALLTAFGMGVVQRFPLPR
jgi:polysaccharide biosynthesis/export protein